MSKKDLKTLGTIASVGTAVVAIHGITSKRWRGRRPSCPCSA
jgi:hypothetical protein